jgi:large subunit ribosomal protein L29
MKIKQLAEMTDKELTQAVTDQQGKLGDLAIDFRTKKVSNVREVRQVKRTIARALTIQRQRQFMQAELAGKEKING